jgi:DNA mismatch endonuclease (patch repair protein)
MDRITKEHRSWNMSRIKGRNTSAELAVRSILHRKGYRFRLNRRYLPGKPDIVLPRFKTVIFVHGCFWHRHMDCKFSYTPKSRKEFWESKFNDTLRRDYQAKLQLENKGWNVIIVWECELQNPEQLASRLNDSLQSIIKHDVNQAKEKQ